MNIWISRCKEKLITTNSELKVSFTTRTNVYLPADRCNIQLNKYFFETKYEDIDSEPYDKKCLR
jgi:hypothetical protein